MMQIGEKINKLTLIEYTGIDKYGKPMGKFRCDCGNINEILIYDAQRGHTKSCGCIIPRRMKIGETKNRLTLLKYAGKNKRGDSIGVFKCYCGRTKKILIHRVKSGHTSSCGCLAKEIRLNRCIHWSEKGYNPGLRTNHGIFNSVKTNSNIYYDSSYEEKALSIWETDSTISSFNRSKDRITYVNPIDGSSHVYLPDFVINDTRMIEIKPQYKLDDPVVQAKAAAAEAYCSERGMTYEIWTEHELGLIK